jgi:thiol-disulfide isomerase/thioredoxin
MKVETPGRVSPGIALTRPDEAFMRSLCYLPLLAGLLATALTGCNAGSQSPLPPVASVPVAVTEVDYAALDAAVKERKGNVVLIDFWATWCPPCRERFPHFVELHKKYAEKGLACVSVSVDPAQGGLQRYRDRNGQEQVLAFLKEKDAAFPNFVLTTYHDEDEKIAKRFGFEGAVPFMVMFDRTGRKVWDSETKGLSDEKLDRLIESELAK